MIVIVSSDFVLGMFCGALLMGIIWIVDGIVN